MKTILWKEWRENGRWGVLALLGLAIALAYSVSAVNPYSSSGQTDKCASVWNAAYLVMTFGCPLIALALGFAQVMPELRRDQWAFLVHRPLPWSVIFGGKAIVGIALSLIAAGLPFLVFVFWTATPGTVPAPFDWRLTLPGVASLLTVIPCYFAGMLTALRPARWYGSRALGLPAAIAAVLLTVVLPEFWDAAAAALVFGAALALAAWGSFLTKGQYEGQPQAAKIGLGVTLFAGSVVTVITLVSLGIALVSALSQQGSYEGTYSYYNIDAQGRILRLTQYGQERMTAVDLSGKTVTLSKNGNGGYNTNSLAPAPLISRENNPSSYNVSSSTGAYRATERLVVRLGDSIDSSGGIYWYYVPRERLALGYRQKTRRLAGLLGPTGLSANDTNPTRFEAPYPLRRPWESNNVFRFPQAVYWLDASVPVVTRIYTARQPGDILGACVTSGQYAPGPDNQAEKAVLVAAADGFHAYTVEGKPLFTFPREHEPARYRTVNALMTPDGKHFFFWYYPYVPQGTIPKPRPLEYVTEVSSAGAVENRYTLSPLPENPSTPPSLSTAALGTLAPPLVTLVLGSYLEIGHRAGNQDVEEMRRELYDPVMVPVWHLFLVVSVGFGLISAMLAWLIARRCVLSVQARWLWAFAAFCLGIYGVLTLLALRSWPARVPCPNCGRPRNVARETCEHCGAVFNHPTPDGTEIFDSASKEIPVEAVARL